MAARSDELPADVSACHALLAEREARVGTLECEIAERDARVQQLARELAERDALIQNMQHQLKQLLRARYGRRSEKLNDPNQLKLFEDIMERVWESPPEDPEPEEGDEDLPEEKPRRRRRGRKPFPAGLPVKRVVHDVPEEERACPECGETRERIGEDISRQLDYVPAHFRVLEHARSKYACRNCEAHVTTAPKPVQPIEKGVPGPGLLAQIVLAKYCDHLPLYRQEGIYARSGVDIPRKTMWGWLKTLALEVEPLYELMKELVLASHKIHTDDTPVRLRDSRKRVKAESRLWVYIGDRAHPYSVFDYTPNRRRDGPVAFLGDWEGYLQADAYSGYDCVYASRKVAEVACMAHASRKFKDARATDEQVCDEALALIGRLYRLERRWKGLSDEERRTRRQEQSVPLLGRFKTWLDSARGRVLPKSPAGQALKYALRNWQALCRYTEHGELEIDNNVAERTLRDVAVGRKNWLFFGSHNGGQAASRFYTLIASCKRNAVEPFAYLRDLFAHFSGHLDARRDDFLPDLWKERRLPHLGE